MGNEISCCKNNQNKDEYKEEMLIIRHEKDYSYVEIEESPHKARANKNIAVLVENETEFKTKADEELFTLRLPEKLQINGNLAIIENHPDKEEVKQRENIIENRENTPYNLNNADNRNEIDELEAKKIHAQQLLKKNIFKSYLQEKIQFLKSKQNDIIPNENGITIKFHSKVIEVDSTLKSMPTYIPSITQRFIKCRHRVNLPPVYTNRERDEAYHGSWNVLTEKFNGYGIFQDKEGAKYEGIWIEGILHNYGRVIHINGDLYEGQIYLGEFSGKGSFSHYKGAVYKGDFKNNQMEGNGEENFPDGSHFQGHFKNGKKNGKGVFKWADGSQYSGDFVDSLFNGHGVYTWADGKSYTGDFQNNVFHGQGLHRFPDGKYFKGSFVNNKRNGHGVYSWNETKYYEGDWIDGVQHGNGIYHKDDKWVKGIWENGKLVTTLESN